MSDIKDTPVEQPTVVEPTEATTTTTTAPETTVEPTTETATETTAPETTAPVTDSVDHAAAAHEATPLPTGVLSYKAPGLKNLLFTKSKYFWFGEEPVSSEKLSSYLRGEKPEVAHPTAAWASQTGKGLLFFSKTADKKDTPEGVINLAEITDLKTEGTIEIIFKHNGKHALESHGTKDRDIWFRALESESKKAKDSKDVVTGSSGYKEAVTALEKPTAIVPGFAGQAPEGKSEPESKLVIKDNASSSSAEKKKNASKNKSRSVSRNKRGSIFGGLLGKKEETEEKKEITPEPATAETTTDAPTATELKSEEPVAAEAAAAGTAAAATTAAVVAAEEHKESKEPAAPVEETPAAPEPTPRPAGSRSASKSGKRTSIFGAFFSKKEEKKEEEKKEEAAPAVPAKDTEPEAAAPESTEAVVAGTEIAPIEPETAPATTEAAKEETADPTEAVIASTEIAPIEPETAPATTEAAKEETTPEKRRTSFFGGKSSKKTEGTEKKPSKLGGIFRSASKAVKSPKETKEASAPETVPETSEAAPSIPAPVEQAPLETEGALAKESIGDVVPEAVSTGHVESTPQISATA